MYYDYFGLKEPPFSIAPDPRYLFMAAQHREALAHLVYGISSEGGFVLLTGEVGTGKTTVCRCLLGQLPPDTDVAFILNPKVSAQELLATVCDELRISYPQAATSIKIFVDSINAYLLDAHARARKTVLIIEEAQNLEPDVLEQVRLLTNLETDRKKLLQVIMIGQPELREMLSRRDLRQLAQRITARYHIGSLSRKEVAAYVNHRLAVAGSSRQLFPPSTLKAIFRLSGGIPRVVNVICDRALLGAYAEGKEWIDRQTLVKAAREVLGGSDHRARRHSSSGWRMIPAAVLTALILAGGGYSLYRLSGIVGIPLPETGRPLLSASVEPPSPVRIETRPLSWPAGEPVETSQGKAYDSLFKQWGLTYDHRESGGPCRQAKSRGLGCMEGQGTLDALKGLNRPAILRLYDDRAQTFYGTLTSLEAQQASLVLGGETKMVSLKELEGRWLGDYSLLWRPPENFRTSLRPGQRSRFVPWVDEKLSLLEGRSPRDPKNTLFDQHLARAVRKFQLERGLVPNGIIGPETVIHLSNATGSKDPSLHSGVNQGSHVLHP